MIFALATIMISSSFSLNTANAAPVAELETVGTATNNVIGSAEVIPPTSFTAPEPATVFPRPNSVTASVSGHGGFSGGGVDVDFYKITTFGSGSNVLTADIDTDIASPTMHIDTWLEIFDSSGTMLAFDGDSFPSDPGSGIFTCCDAYLGEITLAPGTYYVVVTSCCNLGNGFTGFAGALMRPDGAFGGNLVTATPGDSSYSSNGLDGGLNYILHLSLQTFPVVGGEYFTLDKTALLVAGLQTNLAWIIPLLAVAGIGAVVLRKKF